MIPKGIGFVLVELYEWNDAEDGETYWWNATLGRIIAERKGTVLTISLSETGMDLESILKFCPGLDKEKAANLPDEALFSPLLFVTNHGRHVMVDGWHRMYKAATMGINELPAYVLDEDETNEIRLW